MLTGLVIGGFVGLIGYEMFRRDKKWDSGRVASIVLGTMVAGVLMWAVKE